MRQLLVLGLILIISFNFWAQEEKSDTVGIGGLNWFAYPYMFYSPETNLAFGAGGIISISFRKFKFQTIQPYRFWLLYNQ